MRTALPNGLQKTTVDPPLRFYKDIKKLSPPKHDGESFLYPIGIDFSLAAVIGLLEVLIQIELLTAAVVFVYVIDILIASTGKVDVNATPVAAYVMCECIAKYHAATGKMVGFKPAGGISSAADALCYYSIVSSLLGKKWLNKEWFRFGVSRVANSILSAVEQKTVSFF